MGDYNKGSGSCSTDNQKDKSGSCSTSDYSKDKNKSAANQPQDNKFGNKAKTGAQQ